MLKTATITITTDGRDKGKIYRITEMPAEQAEDWTIRIFLALMKSGVDLPEGTFEMGAAGLVGIGFQMLSGIAWSDAKPLLDEIIECIEIQPDPSNPGLIRRLISGDIEEVSTRLQLRKEWIGLQFGFFLQGNPLASVFQAKEGGSQPGT